MWCRADQTAWPWDQAYYAKYSVDLFVTLLTAPSEWLPAMLTALGRQAPGIAWAGQRDVQALVQKTVPSK